MRFSDVFHLNLPVQAVWKQRSSPEIHSTFSVFYVLQLVPSPFALLRATSTTFTHDDNRPACALIYRTGFGFCLYLLQDEQVLNG